MAPQLTTRATAKADGARGTTPLGANLIGGRSVPGEGPLTRNLFNPADATELVAAVHEASPAQVDAACAAAAAAFPAWRATPPPDRARVLFRFRELLEANFDELARSIVHENGKLLSEARGSLRRGLDVVEFGPPMDPPGLGITVFHATHILHELVTLIADNLATRGIAKPEAAGTVTA